ncbi:hypothetical protein V502_10052 [Pseudogymnoascus sp. VKM F-4520 (FW-2644)]|nr:hypothetical protein V502_10052 [Pseudogymnoascus sp. VKM F-4520 (FW-2644)]
MRRGGSALYSHCSRSRNTQELIHYLQHIKEFWHRLLRGNYTALRKVDEATVKALELKSPRYSRRDARVLQGLLMRGQIFAEFSQPEREVIWGDLRSVDGLIPSLFTFFEDLKYLIACAGCLKRLVRLSRQDTVYTAFQENFTYSNQVGNQYTLEVAESTFVVKPGQVDRLDIGYRQLWLYAMRHYREIPKEAKSKLLAKVVVEREDENTLSALAVLANKVGFESAEIYDLKRRSSDNDIARNALLKARRPDQYQYNNSTLEASVAQIVSLFDTAIPVPPVFSSPSLASDSLKTPENRCGFQDEDSYEQDRKSIFITHIHCEGEEQGEEITSFFVRRSVYLAFFGNIANAAKIFSESQVTETNGRDQEIRALVEEERLALVEQEMISLVEEGTPAEVELERLERVQQERFVQEWIEQDWLGQEILEQEA